MWKRSGSIMLASVAAAATIGLGAGQAFAAGGWSVSPGGNITGKAGTTKLKDTSTGTVLSCSSAAASGTAKKGKGLSGNGIASIKSATFNKCKGPLGLTFTVKSSHLPWSLNAKSYKSGVTSGTLTGIHATLTGSGCTATVDGTSATANNGMVAGTYSNSTHALKISGSGGNLHVYNVKGCFGLIHSGDKSAFSGTYKITPAQTITGP
jgi:hypothetical protein